MKSWRKFVDRLQHPLRSFEESAQNADFFVVGDYESKMLSALFINWLLSSSVLAEPIN